VLGRRLVRSGYAVDLAADGAQALEMLKSIPCDLVLLDSMMPGLNGSEVLRRIRERWPVSELPVVMVTALVDGEHVAAALREGANDYITKPVNFLVALARIETQLEIAFAGREVRRAKELYQLAARAAEDGLWDWDLAAGTVYYSPGWKSMLGHTDEEISSRPEEWFDRIHPDDRARVRAAVQAHLEGQTRSLECECRMRHQDGRYVWIENRGSASRDRAGKALRMAGYQTDITARKTVDPLTSLPNRVWLAGEVRAAAQGPSSALLLFDLDGFDRIRQSSPDGCADRLLAAIAERLRDSLAGLGNASDAVVARSGDHQFGVLVRRIPSAAAARELAERLQAAVRGPVSLDQDVAFATASAGIAMISPGAPEEEPFRDAGAALRHARDQENGRVAVFEAAMRRQELEEIRLENDLRRALAFQEFEVYYQPKVNLETGQVDGFEALVRWNRPGHGVVPPDVFIPTAERNGMIVPLGRYVMERACVDAADLRRTFPGVFVSVNVSGRQLAEPDLVEQIGECLRRASLEPAALRLEVTETFLVEDPQKASAALGRIRGMGVGLKLDDFGSGYSSLEYLQRFPFDSIKIDRSFVEGLTSRHESAEIVRAVAGLARSLNLSVVAEGIEDREQLECLRELGCRYGQGYWFSPPLQLAGLKQFLEEWPARRIAEMAGCRSAEG